MDSTPPPHSPTHNTHHNTQTEEEQDNTEEEQDNTRCRTKPEHGGITHTHPAIQHDHPTKKKGDTDTNEGDANIRQEGQHHSTRPSLTTPPHHAMPPHHPRCPHPPPRRGGSRQRTPHHTNTTDRHTPHTTHTRQETVRDMIAVHTRHALGSRRHEPQHDRGAAAHATAIPHHSTPRRMDTTLHCLASHCSRSHNQRTIMINMINNQCSMIDQ